MIPSTVSRCPLGPRKLFVWRLAAILLLASMSPSSGADCPEKPAPMNINTASMATLQTLPGIGEKRAQQIVALRIRRPFRSIQELRKVRGIGPKTLRKLQPLIVATGTVALGFPAPSGDSQPKP
jgi:competence ComEA-like helix-hairpin-helix protein